MKSILYPVTLAAILVFALGLLVGPTPQLEPLAGPTVSVFTSATNSSSSASSTATQAVAANSARQYLSLVNDSAVDVYCSFAATSTGVAAHEGMLLKASGGSFTLEGQAMYTGALFCITSSGTSTLTVIEK